MWDQNDNISYETRAVAFIDLLGLTDFVNQSTSDTQLLKRLHNAVWALGILSKADAQDDTPEHPSQDRVTQFSDSLVVSFPYDQPFDLWRLVSRVADYQSTMLFSGFLLRGGITVGKLFHREAIVFGPALNEAYSLERKANFPRVVVGRAHAAAIDSVLGRSTFKSPFAAIDVDSFYYAEYLARFRQSETARRRIDQVISLGENSSNPRIVEKYSWLRDKWRT